MPFSLFKVMFNGPVVWQIHFCCIWINELMKAVCIIIIQNNYQTFLLNTTVFRWSILSWHSKEHRRLWNQHLLTVWRIYCMHNTYYSYCNMYCAKDANVLAHIVCMHIFDWLLIFFKDELLSKAWKCYFFQVDALQRHCRGRTSHVIHLVTNHSHFAQR